MNEETMNTMNEEIMDEVTELTEVYDEMPEEIGEGSGGGTVIKLVLAGLGAAAIAVGIKKRDKIKEWHTNRQIKKLEKQGFIVVNPDEEDEFDDFVVDCDEDGDGNIIVIKGDEEK